MTLIELTVVLLVLVGLAGLTIPYISGFVGKTHNATSADSGASLFNSLQLFVVSNNGLPNNLNLLTTGSGTTASTNLATYLDNTFASSITPGTAYAGVPTNFTVVTAVTGGTGNYGATGGGSLTTITSSLSKAGATVFSQLPTGTVTPNSDGTYAAGGAIGTSGATFTAELPGVTTPAAFVTDTANGLSGPTAIAVTTTNAAVANITAYGTIASALGYTVPNGHQLIVLGVGPSNSAVGKTLSSVPVHFGDKGSLQPTYTYSRFLAAVDVDSLLGTAPAKIVGIVHAPDTTDGWESLFSSIAGYYAS
jgi:type II secretory pathway pseudopilin PulG